MTYSRRHTSIFTILRGRYFTKESDTKEVAMSQTEQSTTPAFLARSCLVCSAWIAKKPRIALRLLVVLLSWANVAMVCQDTKPTVIRAIARHLSVTRGSFIHCGRTCMPMQLLMYRL